MTLDRRLDDRSNSGSKGKTTVKELRRVAEAAGLLDDGITAGARVIAGLTGRKERTVITYLTDISLAWFRYTPLTFELLRAMEAESLLRAEQRLAYDPDGKHYVGELVSVGGQFGLVKELDPSSHSSKVSMHPSEEEMNLGYYPKG